MSNPFAEGTEFLARIVMANNERAARRKQDAATAALAENLQRIPAATPSPPEEPRGFTDERIDSLLKGEEP